MTHLFGRTAQRYSGSPWFLWLMALTQTMVALELLVFPPRIALWERWLGLLVAVFAAWFIGTLAYYYAHRAQFAANPAAPIAYGVRELLWTFAIILALILVFVVLILTVWRN